MRPAPVRRPVAARACGVASLLLAAACSSAAADAHPASIAAAAVVLGPDGVQPGPDVALPRYGVVVFRNATGVPLQFHVELNSQPCGRCDTALGFHAVGKTAASDPVPDGGTAALCFHEPGAFPWSAAGTSGTWRGTVTVGNGR